MSSEHKVIYICNGCKPSKLLFDAMSILYCIVLVNPVNQSRQEYEAFIKATGPLVKQIAKQAVESPSDEDVAGAQ